MELKPLFSVGETVMIVKPDNPIINWNPEGGMNHLIGQLRTVIGADVIYDSGKSLVRYRVNADGRGNGVYWGFSEDCLREPDGSVRERKEPEPTYDDQGRETVLTHSGEFILKEDAVLTDFDGWVHVDEVLTADDGKTMHQDNYRDHGYKETPSGEMYHRNVLHYVQDLNEYHHEDDEGDSHFYHSDGYYYSFEEPANDRHDYHAGPRENYSDGAKFRFGVEVEKEDYWPMSNYELYEVDNTGWARERDGSLDDESGFELVSPIFDLFGDRFDEQVNSDILSEHINAKHTSSCGGHMGFSIKNKCGAQVFDLYNGFFPLLIAMYRKRLNGNWSKLRTNNSYKSGRHRYSAINVQSGYIEFRIFSAVKDVSNLLWRRDLLRIMAKNPKKGVMWWINQAMNPNSALHNHLCKVYSIEKITKLCAYAAAIAERMNGREYVGLVHFADEEVKQRAKRFVSNV